MPPSRLRNGFWQTEDRQTSQKRKYVEKDRLIFSILHNFAVSALKRHQGRNWTKNRGRAVSESSLQKLQQRFQTSTHRYREMRSWPPVCTLLLTLPSPGARPCRLLGTRPWFAPWIFSFHCNFTKAEALYICEWTLAHLSLHGVLATKRWTIGMGRRPPRLKLLGRLTGLIWPFCGLATAKEMLAGIWRNDLCYPSLRRQCTRLEGRCTAQACSYSLLWRQAHLTSSRQWMTGVCLLIKWVFWRSKKLPCSEDINWSTEDARLPLFYIAVSLEMR